MKRKRQTKKSKKDSKRTRAVLAFAVIPILGFLIVFHYLGSGANSHTYTTNSIKNSSINALAQNSSGQQINITQLRGQILPSNGFVLPAKWGNIVHKAVLANAINVKNLSLILNYSKEPLTAAEMRILNGTSTQNITLILLMPFLSLTCCGA